MCLYCHSKCAIELLVYAGLFSLPPPPPLCETFLSPWRYASLKIKKEKTHVIPGVKRAQWAPKIQDELDANGGSPGTGRGKKSRQREQHGFCWPSSINQPQWINSSSRMMNERLQGLAWGWAWWGTKSAKISAWLVPKVGSKASKPGRIPVYFWLWLLPWLPETRTSMLIFSHSGKSEPAKIWLLYS